MEGIARALRVFLGKDKPPVYQLRIPPGGERELIEVKVAPEVRKLGSCEAPWPLILAVDRTNPSIIRLRSSPRHHLHSPIVPIFHRAAG
jgi:hypothetical protein